MTDIKTELSNYSLRFNQQAEKMFALPSGPEKRVVEAMKYSLIIIAALPLLVAYPFVQKYFVRGMLIGSLKG